jgi:hypothetical protein
MDAKIDIYGISGDVICSVLITKDAVSHEELMTSDYIQLSWNDDKTIVLPAGAYIIYQDEKYSLIEPYLPLRENEAEYKYTPQFHSKIMIWDKIPVPLYTYESDGLTIKSREMDWDFTGSPADAMYMVKQAIKNETGEDWTIQLSESLPATITISSQSTSIFSNLNNIAEECETEWWTDKKTNTLYLSECKYGTPLKLIVGENVSVPSVSESKDGYYTRFYAFGSTRNITQEYDSGQATSHIANKRLGLDPTKYPGGFKDIKGHFENGVFTSDLMPGEIFIKTLFFDKIFPSSKLTISDVRARLKYRLDNNGNKIKIGGTDDEPVYEQYAIWYFQIENFIFDKESIIDGKNLSVSFESGQLAGRDFELKYYDKPEKKNDEADVTTFEIKTGDYEIIIDESTGNIIPGLSYIIPQNGDQIILFNIIMPSEYVSSAQNELEKELDKAISDASKDNNSYEVESYPESFYEHSYDTHLGQEVNFYNGDNILNSRILMVEKHLDFQYEQTIRIGNEHIKGNTQELKEEVANVNQNIDIIKAFNELSTSLSNAYANAQREMIEGFAAIKNIWEFDNDESHWSTDNNGDKRKTIKSKYNVWSSGYISALGTNTSEDSSGTGSFDLLQDWDKYVDSTAKSMALSAFLGKDLLDRVISLEEGQKGHKITISGSGNVVVNVEESSDGGTLTFTKGNIDLSGYATKTELEAVSKKTDSVTQRVDEFLGGSDTDGIINKWKELEAFLDGQQQGTTLSSLLDKKVDKTIQVKAGEGLSGGGALSGNVTLSLATVGTAGTYTKVTVDKYGRVTSHATLSASDIPTLEISKINGLQEELDKKLNISDFGNKFATEMANWFKKDTEGNVFVADSKGFYSESFVSAMGKSSGGSSSGGGSYDRLDNWADYSADRATWVLSAKLGYDLNTRVSSLESGSAINFETSGTGNALTGFSKSGNTVTFTKGTFLTEHQKLYTLTMQRNGEGVGSYVPTADKIININACTAINVPQGFTAGALSSVGVIALSFASGYSLPTTAKQQQWDTAYSFVESIAGSDANGVIDKWNEIISFLDGIGDSSTLEGLLNDINSNVTAVSSRVTKLEGYFVNGVAKEAAKTTGTLSINGKNFNGSASVNVGVIGVSYGGTGKSSVASGSMLYASAANTYAELATTEFGRNLLKANSGSVVSGLNADMLDGVHINGLFTAAGWNTQTLTITIGGVTKSVTIPYASASVVGLVSTAAQTFGGTKTFNAGLIVPAGQSLKIGNGTITWDSTKGCFHFSHGLYSDSFISAMGLNAAGGSGGSYERLDSWSDYTEDKATWVLSALLGSNLNTRVSALEAGGATSVVTSGTGNVVTAVTKSGNVITATKGITALTSHQNIYALTLQGNGSTIGTFNPKTGNSTINITAANIGAAASSHTHNYLPLTGGTITGELSFKPTDSSDAAPKIYSSTAEGGVTNLNFAVADDGNDSFIFRMNYYNNTNEADRERFIINWYGVTSKAAITAPSFNGNLNGNASTASKLGTSTVGGTAKPIYLNAGTATALSATVGSSSLPVYLNAGTITQCGTSLGVSITGNSATTNQLNVSALTSQSLADYKTSGHLYYAGGSNTVSDKPSGVDAFGMFTMQTASGWQGQILMASNTATSLYWRTANNNFNGGWRKILDSSNYGEYAYSKTDADGRFVNLSGDTMTGALKVPELRFTNGTAIWFDQYGNVTFGSTSSSNWWYIGSSSNSPSIEVNFGTGNVGIGQSASTTYKLAVNGDVHANSFTGSLNGNASTASKWQAARTVTMNGFADCSFSIDGSSNVSFDYKPYNFYLSVNNKNNYPWHRIAKIGPITSFYQDKEVTLLLSQGYDGGKWGIVRITLRTNSTGTVSTAHVEWLNRRAFNRTDVKIGLYNASGETYADVFLWTNGAYSSVTGLVLTQGGRGTLGRTWTLVNSSEVNNTTTTDKLTSTECWTSIEVSAEELHKKAYTNIIEADDAGGVGILYDHGKLTAISGTTMPNEGLRLYRAYNNGYPAAYGNLMSVRGENSGAGELLLEWKGSTELGHIYYRSKRDNTSSGWSSWGTLAFLTDNVASATKLQTARSINGTSFDGTENITTFKWGSSRNIYIRDASQTHTGEAVSVDGSSNEYLLLPKDVAFDQITINTKLISNGQTDFNKQWLKNVGGIWFGSADSSSVFASFDGDGTQTGLQSKVGTSIYFGWRGGTRAMTIDSAGNVVIGNTSTVNSAYKLDVKGDVRTQGDIVPYSNGQYNIGSSGARWNTLFTQSIELYGFTPYIDFHFNNSSADYTSRIVEVVSGCLAINGTLAVLKSGNVGIGTTLPTEKLYVSGNIAATGAVTALVLSSSSDIRLKDIRKNVCLSVEEIAKAPAVEFAWKKTGDLAVGSIAQYWQPILPQAIHKRDNYLSMQYDVIALLASIANARRILSIEKKIKELEEEVKRLKIS